MPSEMTLGTWVGESSNWSFAGIQSNGQCCWARTPCPYRREPGAREKSRYSPATPLCFQFQPSTDYHFCTKPSNPFSFNHLGFDPAVSQPSKLCWLPALLFIPPTFLILLTDGSTLLFGYLNKKHSRAGVLGSSTKPGSVFQRQEEVATASD